MLLPSLSCVLSLLFIPVTDSAFGQVVRRHLHFNLITRQNLNVMHSHFTGDVSCNHMTVFQLHAKHGVGKSFDNGTVLFYRGLLSHKRSEERRVGKECRSRWSAEK